jgi:hypothetical protein
MALAGAALWQASASAATHRAGLLVEHSASWPGPRVLWKCVQFAQDAITGLALLELAGVNYGQPPQVYDWGGGAYTVCQIDRQPTPVPDRCFAPTSSANWSDWYVASGRWIERNTGVTGYSVRDGDMEGWTYTSGFGAAPPAASFAQVCPPQSTTAATSVGSHASAAAAAAHAASPPAAPSSSPPPTASASLEAMAPTASPSRRAALGATGPTTRPPPSSPIGTWLLLAGATALLLGLGAVNLLRRGP